MNRAGQWNSSERRCLRQLTGVRRQVGSLRFTESRTKWALALALALSLSSRALTMAENRVALAFGAVTMEKKAANGNQQMRRSVLDDGAPACGGGAGDWGLLRCAQSEALALDSGVLSMTMKLETIEFSEPKMEEEAAYKKQQMRWNVLDNGAPTRSGGRPGLSKAGAEQDSGACQWGTRDNRECGQWKLKLTDSTKRFRQWCYDKNQQQWQRISSYW